ncbi:nucleotide sugar dehydrogenase [Luminiphilus sp.]|nr:nucleotide sugar dehydrogenase [Luminiphilus sp.]
MQVGVVGFGYIGSVIGAVLASKGCDVVAVDSNARAIDDLNNGQCSVPEPLLQEMISAAVSSGNLSGSNSYDELSACDVVLITVGTPLSAQFDADLSAIDDVFENVAKHLKAHQIIMVKSTVPPGVTRQMADLHLGGRDDVYVGFSPERLAEGNAIAEFKSLPIIVGGIDDRSTEKCAAFWSEVMGVEVISVASCESAELVKLANNQWIDLNIALANELAMLCDSLPYELDVLEIIRGANSLKKGQHFVNYLTPSIGVGGYCLTKDPWFVSALGDSNGMPLTLPSAGRRVNDNMPMYCSDRISSHFSANQKEVCDLKIAVLGYSFKTNSGDVRFSPMASFISEMISKGVRDLGVFDSTVSESTEFAEGVTQYEAWRECVSCADCVVFGASHDDIASISAEELVAEMKPGGLIFDGRRYFNKQEIDLFISSGQKYVGVGRTFS